MVAISLSRVLNCPLGGREIAGVDANNMLHYLCTRSVASETNLLELSGMDSGLSVSGDLPEAMGQVHKLWRGARSQHFLFGWLVAPSWL